MPWNEKKRKRKDRQKPNDAERQDNKIASERRERQTVGALVCLRVCSFLCSQFLNVFFPGGLTTSGRHEGRFPDEFIIAGVCDGFLSAYQFWLTNWMLSPFTDSIMLGVNTNVHSVLFLSKSRNAVGYRVPSSAPLFYVNVQCTHMSTRRWFTTPLV